jgi:hypothetical protein
LPGATGERNEKKKSARNEAERFFIYGSTDPVAKERLFLERFTCFQQGQSRKQATLTAQPACAVEPATKSKHHFA